MFDKVNFYCMERMAIMSKWCFNCDSGEYENIEKDSFSVDRGEYVYNWDDSEYQRGEEKERL